MRSPSKTIGSLVRGFKASVTKRLGYSVWQRNYFEHIIRDIATHDKIADYIVNNPFMWDKDKFHVSML